MVTRSRFEHIVHCRKKKTFAMSSKNLHINWLRYCRSGRHDKATFKHFGNIKNIFISYLFLFVYFRKTSICWFADYRSDRLN